MSAEIPHFETPFRVVGGAARTVEQDSPEDVLQCVQSILSTGIGERPETPTFGIVDPTFTDRVDVPALEQVIVEWEPRVVATFRETGVDSMIRTVTARVARTRR